MKTKQTLRTIIHAFVALAFVIKPSLASAQVVMDSTLPGINHQALDHFFVEKNAAVDLLRIDKLLLLSKIEIDERFKEAQRLVKIKALTIRQVKQALFPPTPLLGYVFYLYDEDDRDNTLKLHTLRKALKRTSGQISDSNRKIGHAKHRNIQISYKYRELGDLIGLKKYRSNYFYIIAKYLSISSTELSADTLAWLHATKDASVNSLPPYADLHKNHHCCIDAFFKYQDESTKRGPPVYSIFDAVVLSVGRNWEGGKTLDSYISGGTLPSRGNAVILYNPSRQQLIYYGHLYDGSDYPIEIKTGDIITAGTKLGYGGASGQAALRTPRSGKHTHVELHFISKNGFNSGTIPDHILDQSAKLGFPAQYIYRVLSGDRTF